MVYETDSTILTIAISQILLVTKFNRTKKSSIIFLSNLVIHFIKKCGKLINSISQNCSKKEVEFDDALLALEMLDISLPDLLDFMKNNEFYPFLMENIPKYPLDANNILLPYELDEKCLKVEENKPHETPSHTPSVGSEEEEEEMDEEEERDEEINKDINEPDEIDCKRFKFVVNDSPVYVEANPVENISGFSLDGANDIVTSDGLKLKFNIKDMNFNLPPEEEKEVAENNEELTPNTHLENHESILMNSTDVYEVGEGSFDHMGTQETSQSEHESIFLRNLETCPVCNVSNEQSMIQCDNCDQWHHWLCVGIKANPSSNDPWFCYTCRNL